MAERSTVFVLMLKAPRLGEVKTRLAREVGEEAAFEIYGRLVGWQLAQLAPLRGAARVEVHFTPADGEDEMRYWIGDQADAFEPQCEGDLGDRLSHAMASVFARGGGRVVFLGGDCPFATTDLLRQAEQALRNEEVVLAPALDGGYYLIGLAGNHPAVFQDIAWGGERVLAQTRERIEAAGLSCARLPEARDVDTLADWKAATAAFPELAGPS
ncbi:MAG: TIGR04282 family arsenosugar biosynthesis glycosyltransferase [Verrucomicrobiota bacterium]